MENNKFKNQIPQSNNQQKKRDSKAIFDEFKLIAYIFGALNIVIGLFVASGFMLGGIILIVLGYFIGKQHLVALVLLSILFGIEVVSRFIIVITNLSQGQEINTTIIFGAIFIYGYLCWHAIKEAKKIKMSKKENEVQTTENIDVKKDINTKHKKSYFWIGLIIVLIFIFIVGFFVIDSDGRLEAINSDNRLEARDQIRESDRAQLQLSLDFYFEDHYIYPQSLNQLKGQYLSKIFVDPKTNLSYKYTLKNLGKDYELCVKFETKGEECVGKKDGIFLNDENTDWYYK